MMAKGTFKGLRVVDFTVVGVGGLTIKYLADYGAEVIKIEAPSRIDPLRTVPPFKNNVPNQEGNLLFAFTNTNKYNFGLNLKHPKGLETVKRLVALSDIVAENQRPGVMERLGLGYEQLKEVKQDIIMVSLGAFGRTGPRSGARSTGMELTSFDGFNYITGWPDRGPSGIYGPYTDSVAPLFGAAALHAALDYRHRTGKGQHLDLAQFEGGIQFMAPLILDYVVNNRVAQRMGNDSPYAAPHGVYRCSGEDRWCAIAVFTDEQWSSFCRAIGKEEWKEDQRFSTLVERLKNRRELDTLVEAWTIVHSPQDVMSVLQAARVPAGVVQTGEDLWNDPQLKNYGSFSELDHPVVGTVFGMRRSVELSKMSYEERRPATLGEHTEYVCTEILGMSDEEFVALMNEGVFD